MPAATPGAIALFLQQALVMEHYSGSRLPQNRIAISVRYAQNAAPDRATMRIALVANFLLSGYGHSR
jgi:hypothetical protein